MKKYKQTDNKTAEEILEISAGNLGYNSIYDMFWVGAEDEGAEVIESTVLSCMESYANQFRAQQTPVPDITDTSLQAGVNNESVGREILFEACDSAIYSLREDSAGDNILKAYNDGLNDAIKAIEPVILNWQSTQQTNEAVMVIKDSLEFHKKLKPSASVRSIIHILTNILKLIS